MANQLRQIRGRIRSIRNTARVTRAMQMVAASKMRRAQELVVASRPYAQKLRGVLADLASQHGETETLHPLMALRPVKKIVVVHVTPDRGLCGGLPGNMNRRTGQFLLSAEAPTALVTVGKKGRDFMIRVNRDVMAVFTDIGDRPSLADTSAITHMVENLYTDGEADEVYLAYSQFVSTLQQHPVVERLLPIDTSMLEGGAPVESEYLYEPDAATVMGALLPRFLEMQVYQAVLESIASEQSARMVAMQSATDNANELVEALTLEYNKARQAAITAELLDIVGGVAALG